MAITLSLRGSRSPYPKCFLLASRLRNLEALNPNDFLLAICLEVLEALILIISYWPKEQEERGFKE